MYDATLYVVKGNVGNVWISFEIIDMLYELVRMSLTPNDESKGNVRPRLR